MALPVSTKKFMVSPQRVVVSEKAAGASSLSTRAVLLVAIPLTEIVPIVGLANLGRGWFSRIFLGILLRLGLGCGWNDTLRCGGGCGCCRLVS